MPNPAAVLEATTLQTQLRTLLVHDKVSVRPYGQHLLIQMLIDDEPCTIARLTTLGHHCYGVAFRTHAGRWEPLPGKNTLNDAAELVVSAFSSYLDPNNY